LGEEQVAIKAPSMGAGGFVLVIAVFENTEPAQALVHELSAAGVPKVSVHKGTLSGGDYYRVLQGPHQRKDESVRQKLIDRGYEGLVVSL
jgi:cell division septation protein DedD